MLRRGHITCTHRREEFVLVNSDIEASGSISGVIPNGYDFSVLLRFRRIPLGAPKTELQCTLSCVPNLIGLLVHLRLDIQAIKCTANNTKL